ncbi:MAG: hypothetical protein HPY57_14305 [Ignavibacteria bacterium]|nr:hypothetical protein [Ignavibacteria bacterium]
MMLNILLQITTTEYFLEMFDRYGVTLVSLVVLGFFTWFLIKFILRMMKRQEKKIDELIIKLVSKDDEYEIEEKLRNGAVNANRVRQLIYQLLNEFEADRVSVYEYHNGGKSVAGVDFRKCSNTYEATAKGIDEIYNEQQNLPISVNFLWNKLLIDKKPILISNIHTLEQTDNTIFQILNNQGIKSYYSRLILNYNNKPIGFIVITFYNKNVSLDNEQLKIFNDTSISIGGLINK